MHEARALSSMAVPAMLHVSPLEAHHTGETPVPQFVQSRLLRYAAGLVNGYDIAYGIGLAVAAPYWLIKASARAKVLGALRQRMGQGVETREEGGPTIMIHAVSLGEINAARAMIALLRSARPDLSFIVSTTTATGMARGQELYGSDRRVRLIRYPLDFSRAVNRVLQRLRPELVVLMELEVWPNFVLQCRRRGIPVVLVNGRITSRSFVNYRLGGWLVRRMFGRLAAVCAQDEQYAQRFRALGAAPDRIRVTGTMKFDTAQIAQRIDGADELAGALGLRPGSEPILVCGSTGPGEEQVLLDIYRQLLARAPRLRLVLVPRKPERFDEVAELIRAAGFDLVRRSQSQNLKSQISNCKSEIADFKCPAPVVLGDTMGELRKFYSLADVVFVGRTLLDLGARQHGSDMIEPAALARPVIVGQFTGNFAEAMNQFRAAGAIREVRSADELRGHLAALLSDRETATELGRRAQEVVRQQQGATGRNVEVILRYLQPSSAASVSSSRGPIP